MENIAEKIAYLQGLAEGLGVNDDTKEGRILNGILDILAEMNEYIGEVDDDLAEMEDAVAEVSDELDCLEDDFYDDDCGGCGSCCGDDDEVYEDGIYEIECPECGELVYADEETLAESDVYCPNCHKKLEIEIPDEDEDEDEEE